VKKTPFGRIKKKIVPVFPHSEYGNVFLISTGYPDPNIYPEEIQEAERSAGTVQFLLNTAAIRLAEKAGITPMEAKKRFAPQVREYKYNDFLDVSEFATLRSLLNTATDKLAEKAGISKDEARSRLGDPLVQEAEVIYDYTLYLDESELSKLFSSMPSNYDREKETRLAVTLAMRHRVVKCAKVVDEGNIIDSWFAIAEGDRFKYENKTLVVQSFDPESGAIAFKGFDSAIAVGSDLFLLQVDGSFAYGDQDWTEEDTLALKGIGCDEFDTAFDAVYSFFVSEVSGGARRKEPDTKKETGEIEDMGKLKSSLENGLHPPQLTGAASTGA
jgi:hypothetical protein